MSLVYKQCLVVLVRVEVEASKGKCRENNCFDRSGQSFKSLHSSIAAFRAYHCLNSRDCFVRCVQDSHFILLYTVQVHLTYLLVGEHLYICVAVECLRDCVVNDALVFLQIGSDFE
jgi:hypothetical protein